MTTDTAPLSPSSTMDEVLAAYPGARRALFRRYHIGGCSSCGFSGQETLQALCERNDNLPVDEVLEHLRASHEHDQKQLIQPTEAAALLQSPTPPVLLDVRSPEEFNTVRIPSSQLLSRERLNELMQGADRDTPILICDHDGSQCLDAASYLTGHGFSRVRAIEGGIDAWAQQVDKSMPRYRLE